MKIRLNYAELDRQIEHLKVLGVPPDEEDPVPVKLPERSLKTLNFITVAINHQTTPVVGVALKGQVFGQERRGWDYLRERAILALEYQP